MKGYKKGGLAKPTLSEVKEYFKDAKVVQNNIMTFTIEDVNNIILGEVVDTDYFYKDNSGIKKAVWESHSGYAKILEYKSKQKPMKKVIRLDEPKEESNKPIELTHYLNDRGWEGVTNDLEMNSIKEVKLIPDTQVIYEDVSLFLVKFNDNKYIIYKGHLNDGVY